MFFSKTLRLSMLAALLMATVAVPSQGNQNDYFKRQPILAYMSMKGCLDACAGGAIGIVFMSLLGLCQQSDIEKFTIVTVTAIVGGASEYMREGEYARCREAHLSSRFFSKDEKEKAFLAKAKAAGIDPYEGLPTEDEYKKARDESKNELDKYKKARAAREQFAK